MTDFSPRTFETATGLRLSADVGGKADRPTVMLLHGGGQTRHSWAGAMGQLVADGYHVISYDARGHGDSDWAADGDYSISALASDLGEILADVTEPTALVGASMGGLTSFLAAGRHLSPFLRALVLVDITLSVAPAGAARIQAFMRGHSNGFASIDEAVAAVSAYNPDRPRPKDGSGLMRNLRKRADGRLYWHWDPRLISARPSSEPPTPTSELFDVSAHIEIPTLLVRGLKSDIVGDEGVAELQRLVPQTEVYEVAQAGHMVAGDRNDLFNRGVIEFLKRHMPPE